MAWIVTRWQGKGILLKEYAVGFRCCYKLLGCIVSQTQVQANTPTMTLLCARRSGWHSSRAVLTQRFSGEGGVVRCSAQLTLTAPLELGALQGSVRGLIVLLGVGAEHAPRPRVTASRPFPLGQAQLACIRRMD